MWRFREIRLLKVKKVYMGSNTFGISSARQVHYVPASLEAPCAKSNNRSESESKVEVRLTLMSARD